LSVTPIIVDEFTEGFVNISPESEYPTIDLALVIALVLKYLGSNEGSESKYLYHRLNSKFSILSAV
jgi:hypothetical protein